MALDLSDVTLNERQLCHFELLSSGVFSPLSSFMNRPDYESVLDRMRLQNGILWPLPICLDLPELNGQGLEVGQSVAIRDPEGFLLGVLHIEDMWPVDKDKEATLVFGTTDTDHPGVRQLVHKVGDRYIGGSLEVLSLPLHFDFRQLRLPPEDNAVTATGRLRRCCSIPRS